MASWIPLQKLSRKDLATMQPPLIAIAQLKENSPLRNALKLILGDQLAPIKRTSDAVVGLVLPAEVNKADWAEKAATILLQHPGCVGLVVAGDEKTLAHPDLLRADLRASFAQGVCFAGTQGNVLLNVLKKAANITNPRPSDWSFSRAREVILAKALYRKIVQFSHGGAKDLTNQVLAPLRLLREGKTTAKIPAPWKKNALELVTDFKQCVLSDDNPWWLAEELKDAFQGINKTNPLWNGDQGARIERIMGLLTECRALAGVKSNASMGDSLSVKPLPANIEPFDQSWSYEVLVIDDHAAAWRPIFQELQDTLAQGVGNREKLPVSFTFLTGHGETTSTILAKIPDYDAVLLDVYLHRDLNGADILKAIRRHYVNLPVVIWTSSRAPELPAEAQFAHGFVFKKTTTLDEMAVLLAERIREGNAKRRYPLPGHFFDHSIRSRHNRKTALRIAEYGSKQLDSFHALDEQYFRFFTDHGGRHLIKLMEYLEHLLRPLIHNTKVFSSVDHEREEEILAIYLAVFLHEFGMLRLRDVNEPDWDKLSIGDRAKENQLVRNLHALRGMVMIGDSKMRHWPDEEGQYQAMKRFWPDTKEEKRTKLTKKDLQAGKRLAGAVALITGYHSRFLPIDQASFGKWSDSDIHKLGNKANAALPKRVLAKDALIKRGLRSISSRFFSADRVQSALEQCASVFPNNHPRRDRLRLQCALFRFADAIDVDYTRNPSDFLALDSSVSSIDLRESLKRQVIRAVHAEGGLVRFESCVPPPRPDLVEKILSEKPDQFVSLNPWDLGLQDKGKDEQKRKIKEISELQKRLDDALAEIWKAPADHAVQLGLAVLKNGRLPRKSKMAIASLTALSVAWEIVDEYECIVECGLQSEVRLTEFKWRNQCPPDKLENMLTMLFHPNGLDRLCV